MKNFNRVRQKDTIKPHTYEQLKNNPFPFLNDCNRLQIFEFLYELQQQNQRLRDEVGQKYPGKSLEEIVANHSKLQIRKKMIAIQNESIQKMQIEVKSKVSDLQHLAERNNQLHEESLELQSQIHEAQAQAMQLQKQKRQKEMQRILAEQRKPKQSYSQIFKQLYGDVKNILQESI